MNNTAKDELFNNWLVLREEFRNAKKEKNYNAIIEVSLKIVELDRKAKFIKIMVPLFLQEIGYAYKKIDDRIKACEYLRKALDGFVDYRTENELNKSTDWENNIIRINKDLNKLKMN